MEINTIPISIRPYLIEIAERLWTGHASVMVGAGFSKNAINKADQQKGLPNWNELGDIFYEKIHGELPGNQSKYLNALKLADEVQAAFGRSVLDQILKHNIPDKDFEPSDVHIKLLELPWSDVFTTNYDTLLERTCENVISRRYDVVINQNDIVYSNRPRIIKLHGSFPSERPLIITEEDYRTYPKRFAPFVNTVQQSLLENTLCLIGFSGDDPNFLQWIGWINDNIGKENSPKIYLIGILKLSEAQKKLLATKNIVPIDLNVFQEANGDHKKAIDLFLAFLLSQRKSRENLEWGLNQNYILRDEIPISAVVDKWKAERLAYPNWLICPQENRERLWDVTNQFVRDRGIWDELAYPDDLDFIYEMNWRFEKSLFPLYNDHIQYFENIISRYNPFPDELQTEAPYRASDDLSCINWSTTRQKWLHLTLALLRFYREEGFNKKWEVNQKTLEVLKKHLSPEQNAWFHYEKVLMSIFNSEIDLAKKTLQDWPTNEYDPFWNAKRGMLMAEFGFLEESNTILENCLTTVRKRLNLTPVGNDYKWVSQEAYLMLLFRLVRQNLRLSKNIYKADDQFEDFNERWNILLQFKCSPWQEKKHFDTLLQHKYVPKTSKRIKNNFEIGITSTSYQLGGEDSEIIAAYNFLRFIEELSIPLSLRHMNVDDKTTRGALERIYPNSTTWAYAIFTRSRDTELVDVIFSRLGLSKLDHFVIGSLILEYIGKYRTLVQEHEQTLIAKSFLNKIPIALSRLCVKCSDLVKIEIFIFYIEVLKGEGELNGMAKLWSNLVASSNDDVKTEVMPLLLEIPVINNESMAARTEFKEPFEHLRINLTRPIAISKSIVNDLLKKAGEFNNLRRRALSRLIFLYEQKLLDQKSVRKLFSVIWEKVDEHGFPADNNYYYFAFINWPHPTSADIREIFKKYIIENTFDIQGSKTGGISIKSGQDRYAEELWYGSANINHPEGTNWTTDEMAVIVNKCVYWWENDKHFLTEDRYRDERFGGSIHQEFLSRFTLLANIICRVFGHQRLGLKDDKILSKITELIKDMAANGVPILKAKIAFADILNYTETEFIKELEENIIAGDRAKIIDALEAAAICLFYFDHQIKQEYIAKILDIIVQPLKWRNFELSGECLSIIENILNHKHDWYLCVRPVVLATLDYLNEFTDISNRDKDEKENIPELLLLRQRAMKLASTIFKIDPENPPEVVRSWQSIADNPNEFGDIKRQWKTEIL